MTTFIITILTSSVLAAIISGLVNYSIKTKEIRVQINLEEKNRWYNSVNKVYPELLSASSEHMEKLFLHIKNKDEDKSIQDILNVLKEHENNHYTLTFLIRQCSYVPQNEIDEVLRSMDDIRRILLLTQNIYYKSKKKSNEELVKKWMRKVEVLLSLEKIKLSKKVAYLVKNERQIMTHEITKNRMIEIVLSLIK
ncbi:hypothetical protein [Staphylococcus hominis]